MDTLLQKSTTFPGKQNLADIYNMHPQIMSWENPSKLQNLSKPQNQVSSTSSSLEVFPNYQVAQALPNSQYYTPSASQPLLGSHVSVVPQTSTTQVLPVTNTEPAFNNPVYVEDWLTSDRNPLGDNPYAYGTQSRQMAPLHATSNLMIETQTCLSDLSQTYCTNNEPIEDIFFNYHNNCMSSNHSIQELAFDTVNLPTQTTLVQNVPNYANGSEFINQNWPEEPVTPQCHPTSALCGINDKQLNRVEYQLIQPYRGPRAIPCDKTTQDSVDMNNPREGRGKIEKQRRDKLNQSIAELSCLVPEVANSNRKFDKTSILRLSAHYLRLYNYVFRDVKPSPNSRFTESSVNTALGLLNGFLLTTTYKGIVVLISNNISEYLGYNEVDLLGHNILNIIHEDDTYIMIEQLKPKPELLGQNGELIFSDEPDAEEKVAERLAQDKRRFVVRFKKFSQRSNPGQYVSCYVEGSFRKSDKARGFMQPLRRIRARAANTCSSGNDIVFIGVVRPVANNIRAEKKVESFHTEYVTYHSIDGEITECDKRISLATGYMTQEVMGINAMNFIHKDDVQWVVIALQQMYDKHSLFSESFYRLMIKTGQFIYMRTRGYLQVDESSGTVNTLICNNTIIEEDEGERMLKMMKHKYCASINQNVERNDGNIPHPKSPVAVVDPKDLLNAVFHMIQSLPSPARNNAKNAISADCNSPSLRLTYKPPKRERIVSAIQKMYTFINTFHHDIQQAQNTLNNQRSLNKIMSDDHSLLELEYGDSNLNQRSNDISVYNKHKEINDKNRAFVFGSDNTYPTMDRENQSYRMLTKTCSKGKDNEEGYGSSSRCQQPWYFEPLQNKQQASIKAYCDTTDLDTIQNICKIGLKRSNEYTDRVTYKKKVTNYENSEQSQIDLLTQDKPLDNYFSDEDLQKQIDQTLNALDENASSSLADLIDFDDFVKKFGN